ncbi:MAG: hypothetical protein ACQESF_07000 [Nanobdellota archaeon]
MWGKKIALMLIFFLIIPLSTAITINPTDYTINKAELNKEYNIVITAINPEPNQYGITVNVAKESEYLKDIVTIEPKTFTIAPNSNKNIKLDLKIPEDISPEKHKLYINFRTLTHKVGSFRLNFKIEGEQNDELELNDVNVKASNTETPIYFTMKTENIGNVIAHAKPHINIYKDNNLIHSLGNKSTFKVLPKKKMNVSLMYDPSELEKGGIYSFKSYIKYSNKTTQSIEKSFTLNKIKKDKNTGRAIKQVKEGKDLQMGFSLENNQEGISFYKIQANVKGENISKIIEGSVNKKKDVKIKLDTSSLKAGEYILTVKKSTGKNIENIEKKEYTLKIKKTSHSYIIILGSLFILGILAFLIYIKPKRFKTTAKSLFSDNPLKKIERKIKKLDKNYQKTEKDINQLGKEINQFIDNANVWLNNNNFKERFR